MGFKNIVIEHRGAVSWLYLNREKALNAISLNCAPRYVRCGPCPNSSPSSYGSRLRLGICVPPCRKQSTD